MSDNTTPLDDERDAALLAAWHAYYGKPDDDTGRHPIDAACDFVGGFNLGWNAALARLTMPAPGRGAAGRGGGALSTTTAAPGSTQEPPPGDWSTDIRDGRPATQPAADGSARAKALRLCVDAIEALFDPLDGEPAVEWHAAEQAARAAQAAARAALDGAPREPSDESAHHGLDNDRQVFFYEQDFYVLSNFSAFTLDWCGIRFDTSEAAYHWEKFAGYESDVQDMICEAPSAHAAFKIAESQKMFRRPDWDEAKVCIMRRILFAKADQHEYVRRKLLDTGNRELIENSWRDDFWGWGPNRDGQNMLGKLWMEVRAELRNTEGAGRAQ